MKENELKRYSIGLITRILLTASALPLIAQEDASGLTLEKDGEQVLIPLDEWVVVSSAYDPSNTVRGLYMGMTVDALRIQEKGESFEREIPMDEIGSIFRGKTKSTKEYVWGGIKLGGLVSVGIGGLLTVMLLNDSRSEGTIYRLPGSAFTWGGLFGLWSGFFTVPAGALIGPGGNLPVQFFGHLFCLFGGEDLGDVQITMFVIKSHLVF